MFVLLVLLPWIAGLGQDARAGVTIDVVFRDATEPSGITIYPGDPGPGCEFGGYYEGSVSSGYCMDVVLHTTDTLVVVSASVAYGSDNGLAVASFYEWQGVGVSFNKLGTVQKSCSPLHGLSDSGTQVGHFECAIPPPNRTTPMPPGTYKIGTIVWDPSSTTVGTERIWIVDVTAGVVINGNVPDIILPPVLGSHVVSIVPEAAPVPSLGSVGAALLGGLMLSSVLWARRCR